VKELIEILHKIVNDFDVKIMGNSQKFKAAFTDYSKGKFKGERDLLIKIIEIGSYNAIINSEDISVTKRVLIKKLHDEYLFDEKACSKIIDIYSAILKKDNNYKTEEFEKSSIIKKRIADKVQRNKDIWICGNCSTSNHIIRDFCKNCGKEFWPE